MFVHVSRLRVCFWQVRSWKDDRHSVAYDMQPITDFNEVTMHALEIIYTHLFNTKGPLPGKSSVGGGAAVAQPMHVSQTGGGGLTHIQTRATIGLALFNQNDLPCM